MASILYKGQSVTYDLFLQYQSPGSPVNFLWNPSLLNVYSWYDTSDPSYYVTTSGGLVSQLLDISGNDRPLIQASSSSRPALINNALNGFPSVRLDGVDDFMSTGPSYITDNTPRPFSIAIVYKRLGSNINSFNNVSFVFSVASDYLPGISYGRFFQLIFDDIPTVQAAYCPGNNTAQGARLPRPANEFNIHIIRGDVSLADYSINGAAPVPSTLTTITPWTSNIEFLLGAGANWDNYARSFFANMEIVEIVAINELIGNNDVDNVTGYLAHKWGLLPLLPASHPYKVNPPIY